MSGGIHARPFFALLHLYVVAPCSLSAASKHPGRAAENRQQTAYTLDSLLLDSFAPLLLSSSTSSPWSHPGSRRSERAAGSTSGKFQTCAETRADAHTASSGCGDGIGASASSPSVPFPASGLSRFLLSWPSIILLSPHCLNGIPIWRNNAKPSASVRAVVVIEMFMPLVLSTLA